MLFQEINQHKIYYYDSDDLVVSHLKQGNLYGFSNYNILNSFITEPGIIIDAGAHIGTFSFYPAIKGQQLILIEAAQRNLECLHATFDHMDNVSIYGDILLDTQKNCGFSTDYGPGGMVSDSSTVNKKSSTIDKICKNIKDNISAIKLDIEGSEPEAIIGAKKILSKYKPPILIEVNGHCLNIQNKRPTHLFNVLDDMNYSYFLINTNTSIIPIDKTEDFPFCVIDIIAIHNDNISKYIGKQNILPYLEKSILNQILVNNKASSNEDCEKYFNTFF
jgi:FkbM family methyltransferase